MNERLAQVNRMLDRACKRAGMDPVDVRLAMIQTLNAKLTKHHREDQDRELREFHRPDIIEMGR